MNLKLIFQNRNIKKNYFLQLLTLYIFITLSCTEF